VPDAIGLRLDRIHRPSGEDAIRLVLGDEPLGAKTGVIVGFLEQEPTVATVLAAAAFHEVPHAFELLAMKLELEMPSGIALLGVGLGRPGPAIPDHHRARTVLLRGDHALEFAILERMVLDVHGQSLVVRIEARPLGDGPREKHAVELQPEVEVQPRCGMLLDHERECPRAPLADLARGLGCDAKVTLLPVALEGHQIH
jgi:hypothetical protein